MNWTLDECEAAALRRFLDTYLPEFDYDVARIDLQSDRLELAAEYQVLHRLRERLDVATPPLTR